jgi:hypothetical protein
MTNVRVAVGGALGAQLARIILAASAAVVNRPTPKRLTRKVGEKSIGISVPTKPNGSWRYLARRA